MLVQNDWETTLQGLSESHVVNKGAADVIMGTNSLANSRVLEPTCQEGTSGSDNRTWRKSPISLPWGWIWTQGLTRA